MRVLEVTVAVRILSAGIANLLADGIDLPMMAAVACGSRVRTGIGPRWPAGSAKVAEHAEQAGEVDRAVASACHTGKRLRARNAAGNPIPLRCDRVGWLAG